MESHSSYPLSSLSGLEEHTPQLTGLQPLSLSTASSVLSESEDSSGNTDQCMHQSECHQNPYSPSERSLLELEHSSTILGQSIYQLNGSRDSFGPINPTNEPNPDPQKEKKGLDLPGSWVWEVGAALLSTLCISLLVGFLAYVDGKTYGSWGYGVSPNAIVSTITTIAKGATLVSVSSCLSQLKWNRYQFPTPLYHLQVVDDASRGPWGALTALLTMTPGLATVGAFLMVVSVGLDPFTQQILAFPSRNSEAQNATASVQMTREYVSNHSYYTPYGPHDPLMEETVLNGISDAYTPLEPYCSTGSCGYRDFITLGVCSKCEDITSSTVQNCSTLPKGWQGWGDGAEIPGPIPLNCMYTTPNGVQIVPGILHYYYDNEDNGNRTYFHFNRATWTSIATEGSGEFLGIINPIIQFSAAKYEAESVTYTPDNLTAPAEKPILTECAIYYCEQQYTQNNVSVNHRILRPTRTHPLRYVESSSTSFMSALGPPDGTDAISENSTYWVVRYAEWSLRGTLVRWLNTTNSDSSTESFLGDDTMDIPGFPASSILYNRGNLNKTFSNIAASITDTFRASTKAVKLPGQAFQIETYIHVRWMWLIPSIANVMISIGLLVTTAIVSRKSHAVLWKSSMLPLLMSRVETHLDHDLVFRGRVDELERASKTINVLMKEDEGHLMFTEN